MLSEKKTLSAEELEAQNAFELPDRDMLALVNVIALNGANVAVPVSVAANVCDVDAAVLAQELDQSGSATCQAQNETPVFQDAKAAAGVIQ